MGIEFDPLLLGIKPCVCGRLSTKIHCPFCGSYDCQGRKGTSKRTDLTTKQTLEYPIFKCRHCTRMFDDFQWKEECDAPKRITKETLKVDAFKDKMEYALTSGDVSGLNDKELAAVKLVVETRIKYNKGLEEGHKKIAEYFGLQTKEPQLPSLIQNEENLIDEL